MAVKGFIPTNDTGDLLWEFYLKIDRKWHYLVIREYKNVFYFRSESTQNLEISIKKPGANKLYQDDIYSTDIYSDPELTPTDTSIAHAITEAHNLGLYVMMRVHIDLADDPTHWRGQIGSTFNSSQWNTWFSEYETFITGYAALAETNSVEQFVVGTELSASQHKTAKWRNIISAVRSSFAGVLTYAANHDAGPSLRKNIHLFQTATPEIRAASDHVPTLPRFLRLR